MYDRITEHGRAVLRGASQEAYALNHDFVRTEHLLLALLRDENGPAVALLRDCGINTAAALGKLVERTPPFARKWLR